MNDYLKTWTDSEELYKGIWVYRNTIPENLNIINRLENILSKPLSNYQWQEALVGYMQKMPEHRDCVDFKFKKTDILNDNSDESRGLQSIWQDCYDRKFPAIQDYCNTYNIYKLDYLEAFNFIRYEKGNHFNEHTDQGFSYNCTVSAVTYLNDDYEGGELSFGKLDLKIKPKAGDLYLFPSTYLFSHRAMPVTSGIKYSIATMLDYNKKFHTKEMHDVE